MNPNRECRVCKMIKVDQRPILELIEIAKGEVLGCPLGEPVEIPVEIPMLRSATENCPACILAALRQSERIHCGVNFDFKKEMKGVWADINEANFAAHNQPQY